MIASVYKSIPFLLQPNIDNLGTRRYFSKCDFNLSSEIDHEITKAKKNKITLPDDVNGNRGSLYSEVNTCNSSYDKSILGKDNFHKGRTVSNTRSNSLTAASSRTVCSEPHCRFGSATTVPYRQINRGRPLTESEYKARYWGQMLDTLRRTNNKIYSACETDENEVECKEVIMILEHSKQDFFSLIEKMNLLRKPIMCQVLASTGVVTSAQQSYISLPLSIKSDSSVIEVADSDSDIGCCRSGSRSYLVDKHQLNTVIDANKHHRHNDESCTIPPNNSNLCNLDNDPSDANDGEYEDEVEVVEDEEEEERHHNERQNMPSSFTYLVDDDADYIDQEDNTLSHDLEKLDKAIANVTTVERVLSHQLDRAQLAEASLRRRLIKEEKAAFVLSAGYNNQLWYKSRLKNTVNKSQHSEDVDICDIVTATDDVEIDTDIDLLDMDSILIDDVDGSEKLLSGNMRKVTKGSNEQQHQQLTRIICSPLNFVQQSSQHRSNVGSNRIESNNKIIDDSSGNHFHYDFCNCRCHRHNYTFNHHLSPIDFQCYKIDSQDKHLVSVERTHVQNSSNSVYMNKIENDVYEAKSPLGKEEN
ncbi:S phase cyclin A-associated protein in the endoplasmic reticulum [Schistosoma japonicum]|uniref:S phase cyclin A-associated protein in the endoplasmic reticulum n=1 Tax=Schistosoma japonicum TaxID=6182 RepID=A0A4Z2D0H1_SCHJA|nr:S phase cyclin A-associated protein in the endoplasmic reticulum [Schistosoma japonicum]